MCGINLIGTLAANYDHLQTFPNINYVSINFPRVNYKYLWVVLGNISFQLIRGELIAVKYVHTSFLHFCDGFD